MNKRINIQQYYCFSDTLINLVIQIHIIDTDPYYLDKYLKIDFALQNN